MPPLAASAASPSWFLSPAFNTAAVAIPSGKVSLASTIKARRKGTVNNTPINPPILAILATSK